jgi:hypothetical protein
MNTDALVALLAAQAQPVRRHVTARRLGLALAVGLPLSAAWLLAGYGLRPGLADSFGLPMAWLKLLLPAALALAAARALHRLARPGVPLGAAWMGVALPLGVMWGLGALAWLQAEPAARDALLWGQTWRVCAFNIAGIALPVFAGLVLALRGLAPTRPVLAGAAAGLAAGAAGAAVYALHCPELGAPFIAVWYSAGMALTTVAGAAAGARWLRW